MKQLTGLLAALVISSLYTLLKAAAIDESRPRAYSITLASSSSTSPRDPISPRKPSPRVAQTVDESTLDTFENELAPADCERIRAANAFVDSVGVRNIDINHLIDIDTENYLSDQSASYRLAYIERELGKALSQSKPDYKDRYALAQTLTTEDLIKLVDHAAEGTLADRIIPYSYLQFMRVRDEKRDIEPHELDLRSYATMAILVAAVNRNLKVNPTYNMFRNHARQNKFVHESDEYLDAFYSELNRPRKGVLSSSAKKKRGSLLMRSIAKRFSRHKRSASAVQL
jgi:hypothetical protein